ncbi:MAG: U32 family peptidase [Oscillospiraceae bacterium]|nr:U32 family peptidase [Oscillospiraceae bacterium]
MSNLLIPEVLAPAGDMERLEYAIRYGADAVYLGGKTMGMRTASQNFDFDQMKKACDYAHARGVKVYLTCNILPNNKEVDALPEYFRAAEAAGIDALIIADIGTLMEAKRVVPDMEIHMSTQVGIVNYMTARELYNMGAKRIVLAREVPLDEIRQIRDKTPPEMEIECFVHGAMCVSFSGRCLLSQYLVGRHANRGECAQPCRWAYHLVEEKRPGQYFPIVEEDGATYILNAKDMNMVRHIDKLVDAGINSLKIEGRAKSFYYVACVTNAYRSAVDHYLKDRNGFVLPEWIDEETRKVSHRQYTEGFYFGPPENGQYHETGGYVRSWDVVAVVDKCENGKMHLTQRNKFSVGDEVEIMIPRQQPVRFTVKEMFNEAGESITAAPHAMMKLTIPFDGSFPEGSILRVQK